MDRRNCVVDFMMLDTLIYLLLKSLTLFSLTKSTFHLLTQSVSLCLLPKLHYSLTNLQLGFISTA